ncbi:hypothetical protein GALL_494120 [mine drainage metagenome]|uniref:Uncharacterized protein n=1 Tax=mine drainage metagenome TaxID=410659 RepID=A0A1J5PMK1_9ZZZZ
MCGTHRKDTGNLLDITRCHNDLGRQQVMGRIMGIGQPVGST